MGRIARDARETMTIAWEWVFLFLLLTILIIWLVYRFKKKNNIDVGNAQILGSAQVQNDYFATYQSENGLLIIVSDGIGRDEWGRRCAEIVVSTYLDEYKKAAEIMEYDLFLRRTLRLANQRVTKVGIDIGCGATVSVGILKKQDLHWLNVGNSAIMIANREEILRLNDTYTIVYVNEPVYKKKPLAYYDQYMGLEDDLKAQSGVFFLNKEEQIIFCTDGVYLQISEMDMLGYLRQRITSYEKAQNILLAIQRKQRTDQDNATIVVINNRETRYAKRE